MKVKTDRQSGILTHIEDHLPELLATSPSHPGGPSVGVSEYDLVTTFPDMSAREIRLHLEALAEQGKLTVVEEKPVPGQGPLKLYLPAQKRKE